MTFLSNGKYSTYGTGQYWTEAAAFGTGDEVEALLMFGANPATIALPLRWTALHHAVFYGNLETFLVLIDPKYNASIHSVDARGWTLLHIAASAGHDVIVRHLLSLGVNHKSLSLPYPSHMPDELINKTFTPGRAAFAQSIERYKRYIVALQDFGLEIDLFNETFKEDSEDNEVFIDAEEYY
jgi:hypothetical protein